MPYIKGEIDENYYELLEVSEKASPEVIKRLILLWLKISSRFTTR